MNVKAYNNCRFSTITHMSQYTTISIDKETKERAAERAKKDRISVSVIARILLNDYADGKISIGSRVVLTENGYTPEFEASVLRETAELEAEIEAGTAKSFSTAEELMEDLMNDDDV